MARLVRFEIDRTKSKQFVLRVRAKNGEIVLSGETTKNKAFTALQNLINAISRGHYEIADLTPSSTAPVKTRSVSSTGKAKRR